MYMLRMNAKLYEWLLVLADARIMQILMYACYRARAAASARRAGLFSFYFLVYFAP